MTLTAKIQEDTKSAMRAKDALRLSTLRLLQASMKNRALEKRAKMVSAGNAPMDAELTDEEIVAVMRSELKKRKDAATEYEKGGRPESAAKEMAEAEILQSYLPAEASDAVIETAVAKAIATIGKDQKQFGKIVGMAMKELAGYASGERVSKAVKLALEG